MTAESEENKNSKATAEKAETGAKSVGAKARQATGAAGARAKNSSAVTASTAKSAAQKGKETAEAGNRAAHEVTHLATAGWQNGRAALQSTAGKAVGVAGTAWTVLKHRKAIVAGAATAVAGAVGGAYALGRSAGRAKVGPLTRMTKGRL